MHASPLHYFPITGPFLAILGVLFVVVLALVQLGILEYAYAKIGIQPRYVFLLLLLSLLGSYINIPVAQMREKQVVSNKVVSDWGVQYVVPEVEEWPQTIIAVNVGGCDPNNSFALPVIEKSSVHSKLCRRVDRRPHCPPTGTCGSRRGNCPAAAHSAITCGRRGVDFVATGGACLGLHFRKPGHADRSRLDESRQYPGAARAGAFHRWRGDIRRRVSDRNTRRDFGLRNTSWSTQ